MNKKYEVLEYHKILNNLIDKSKLEITKEKFIDLKIYTEKSELDKEFSILQDLLDFYKYDGGFDLEQLSNIRRFLKPISIFGNYLESEDLDELRKNLIVYRVSKSRAKNVRDKYKQIWNIFKDVNDLKDLENFIDEVVDDNGNIKDNASLTLVDIRKQKTIIFNNIKEKFDALINNKDTQRAIQDKIITKRNERYVIAIKTDFKGLVRGIEHDRSSTGSTSFIEPLNVVSLNNKLREYEAREKEEIRKILLRITEILRGKLEDLELVQDILERIDFLNAKVEYAIDTKSNIPKIINNTKIHLVDARHPFISKDKVVPLSFDLDEHDKIMLITGPNTGGKTVSLKVAGLFTLMALSGLAIPASEKSIIGMFDNVLSDIGDEQSIEQSLSSFSSHVRSISEILNQATSKSLILLDELGSGTDPSEGSAFAMAIIDHILERKIKSLITTHYSQVKAHAYTHEGIKSASMEFNAETLSPTYRLLVGIPGESNALIIASKYGISKDIIDNAKSYISEDNREVEKMLSSIKEKNDTLEAMNLEVNKLKEELANEKANYEYKIAEFEKEKNNVLKEAYDKAENYIKDMQNKAKALVDKINSDNVKKEEAKILQKNMNMIKQYIEDSKKENVVVKKYTKSDINFEVNEEVLVKTLNQVGKVMRVIPEKNSLQVQAGILKIMVSVDDVAKIPKKKNTRQTNVVNAKVTLVKGEIDVRGKNAEESIEEIETYFNRAILNGFTTVAIIHGKGTMVLRKKIHEYLKKSVYVKEFKDGHPSEGGLGITIVTLK
ncbi:endonuclease MutS2 [Streptobacillus felis]|uniref:Endonuclease MutS2 n=1 Tax=Streptobacillus felis TaxID=1384509 RepID=A0A7Z0T815_9FUSO|nr:endonuclease MutS2 [Streptobacillus felis]NYV27424.1 endonuclease MutS2 [Streptobacillus felis]